MLGALMPGTLMSGVLMLEAYLLVPAGTFVLLQKANKALLV